MPEGNTTIKANGSWVGDTMDEFKKLPTWGKVAVFAALGLVVFLAIRARSASSTAQKAAASTASTDPLGTAGAATTGTQSPFPMVGNLPVLPSGTNPIFDSAGNPIAFQQAPPTVPGSSTNGNPKPTSTPTVPSGPVAFPGGSPGGPPVQKPVRTVATLVNNPMNSSASTTPHVSSAVTAYTVKGVSPAPARVAAQRTDIQQLRTEQAPVPLRGMGPQQRI